MVRLEGNITRVAQVLKNLAVAKYIGRSIREFLKILIIQTFLSLLVILLLLLNEHSLDLKHHKL